ncbi:hypothetical protein [Chryseobacterium populi]|uniref:Uncharacterized protein n=1 Tax=Chryseobacterium populi TaxID=1144316 RepID=J3CP14_9FLAO|nr:hypothetical protein [Chryseobacterium populi]EJL75366.1 hypothetical protein PMI13_00513 [Chryseobacterium populi]
MGTYVKITNIDNKEISDQQLNMLSEYNRHFFDEFTHELLKIEKFSKNFRTQEIGQIGGEVYVLPTENLNTVINNYINNTSIGTSWVFYHNKQTNNNGDVKWDYFFYRKGILNDKGIVVYDDKNREIASCRIDLLTDQKIDKCKKFYGDPSVFDYEFGNEMIPNIKFWYNDSDNNIKDITFYENEYLLNDFLADSDIMQKFPWNQHSYYHLFEPILPS